MAASAAARVSACQISRRSVFTVGCIDFGNLFRHWRSCGPNTADDACLGTPRRALSRTPWPRHQRRLRRDGEPAGLDVDQAARASSGHSRGRRPANPTEPSAENAAPRRFPLLTSLGRGPENDQHTLGLRLHPGLEVDAVGPHVDVAPRREIAALPVVILLLPLPGQPRNHTGRQVRRVRPEERRKRLLKIAHRQAAQVEYRQQGIEAFRAPRPFRQDRRGEAHLLVIRHVGGAITHLRTAHIKRADPGLDGPLWPVPFAIGLERMATRWLTAQPADDRPAASPRHVARRTRRLRPVARPPASGAPRPGRSRSADPQRIRAGEASVIVVSSVMAYRSFWKFWQASTPATIRRLLKPRHPNSRIAPATAWTTAVTRRIGSRPR